MGKEGSIPTRLHGKVREELADLGEMFSSGYRENCETILKQIHRIVDEIDLIEFFFNQVVELPKLSEMVGAQSYIVYSDEFYYVRLNFWLPKIEISGFIEDRIDKYFSIGVLHNHSFDFFTVGLLGPGYQSTFYRPVNLKIEHLEEGDHIQLEKTSVINLDVGRVIFVSKSYDFHVQYEPESLSISLNFIPKRFDDIGSADNAQLIVDQGSMEVLKKFVGQSL